MTEGPTSGRGPARPPRRRAAPTPGSSAVIAGGPVADDGYEYDDLPSEGSVSRWLGVLIVLAILTATVAGGSLYWYNRQLDPPGSPGQTVSVEVPQGASTSGIGSVLEAEGVIANSMVFNFYASRKGAGSFEAGIYRLKQNSDVDLVLATMAKGPSEQISAQTVRVSIPEGLKVAKLTARAAAQVPRFTVKKLDAALAAGKVPTSLRPEGQPSYEGLLFPATYEVGSRTDEVGFLTQLADEMQTRLGGLDVVGAKAKIKATYGLDLSTYQLLTVASMVQAEAGNPEEGPKIATVIYNRLHQDIALGIDASDRYGAELTGNPVDFEDANAPYNTRRRKGLPPTPISAPGDLALAAALAPANGAWLYYVLAEPNIHVFVNTKAEFEQAVRVCKNKGLGCG